MIAVVAIAAWLAGAVPWFIIARRTTDAAARAEANWTHERGVLLNRIMARSLDQFVAHDSFLSQPDEEPKEVLYDATGLLEATVED